jgi:type IV secretion system protein VirB5
MALGCLALDAALFAAYVAERRGGHVAAYIVPINEYGRPGRIELLGKPYDPTVAEEGYFVADWIRAIRARPKDPVVLRENWLRAYDFTAPEALAQLDGYARSENIFKDVGSTATAVSVSSIIPRSPQSFQVNWRETKTDSALHETKENWTSLVTFTHRPPSTETELRKNPLGLFVTAFQLSRELP